MKQCPHGVGKPHLLNTQEYPQVVWPLGECQLLPKLETFAELAQLDRARGYEPRGQEFESLIPHQN